MSQVMTSTIANATKRLALMLCRRAKQGTVVLLVSASLLLPIALPTTAGELQEPHLLLEKSVQNMLDEFSNQRALLQADKGKLFALVDRIIVPLFDFKKVSKLVLASHWRTASEQQRQEFSEQFKDLLIRTYATALFEYTGSETMTFSGSTIREHKGRKFAEAKSAVTLGANTPPVAVTYELLLDQNEQWKIYNLTINGLNMISNYRTVYSASIAQLGLAGMIEQMKQANTKNL